MNIEQKKWTKTQGWEVLRNDNLDYLKCNLVIAFGSTEILSDSFLYDNIKTTYPNAHILMNSTSGEIIDRQVNDETISLTAIEFEKTKIKTAITNIETAKNSFNAAYYLARALDPVDLTNVLIIADGQKVNGSDLVSGLQEFLPKGTMITGGLAGSADRFQKTLVGLNETPAEGRIAAIGFYGKNLTVTSGSVGGWDAFGPERTITKSKGNILYELDGVAALDVYKSYLGEHADELPGSGLLFPISIRKDKDAEAIIRTILSIDEDAKSIAFAGSMPEEYYAQLMKTDFDHLIEGASDAATNTMKNTLTKPDLAILISCAGRKSILNHRIEEEVEVVKAIFGDRTAITGFYSYGEISSSYNFMKCELHNQTMTITTLSETI